MINALSVDMLGTCVYAFLSDLLVCGKNVETHLANLETVLLKLRDAVLKANPVKCEFLKSGIWFLSHKIDNHGIYTMDDKISAFKKFPWPKSVETFPSLFGLCGYCRSFINGFAKLASPLTQLLKMEVPLHCNAL